MQLRFSYAVVFSLTPIFVPPSGEMAALLRNNFNIDEDIQQILARRGHVCGERTSESGRERKRMGGGGITSKRTY